MREREREGDGERKGDPEKNGKEDGDSSKGEDRVWRKRNASGETESKKDAEMEEFKTLLPGRPEREGLRLSAQNEYDGQSLSEETAAD